MVEPGPDLAPKAAASAIFLVIMEHWGDKDQEADELLQLGVDIAKLPPPADPINYEFMEEEEEEEEPEDEDKDKDDAPKIKSLRPEYTKAAAPEPAAPVAPVAPMPVKPRPAPTPASRRPTRPSRPSAPPSPPPADSPWGTPPKDDGGGWTPKPL